MVLRWIAVLATALLLAGATPDVFAQVVYTTTLSGAAAVPPNASTAVGSATITYVPATSMMTVSMSFSGLSGIATAAHIHCCTSTTTNVGVATSTSGFTGFPTGATSGTYQHTFDMTLASSFNPAFVTASGGIAAARQRLLDGMGNRTAYLDIHTAPFPGGELRGNLVEQSLFRNGFD